MIPRKPLLPLITVLFLAFLAMQACKKDYSAEDIVIPPVLPDHNMVIRFKPVVDTQDLVFGDSYSNFFNESYSVSTFKFYVHGIQLINTDSGKIFSISADKYFLVDLSDSAGSEIKLAVQPYLYNRIAFTIGVDSAHNVSGAQTGALDPANGMFWTWNSGYIMAKMEGNSPSANTSNNKFEFHIGGFAGPDNVVRSVNLLFPYAQAVDLQPEKSSELTITANANAWFYNPFDIKLSVNPVCTTPGPLAREISENYAKMFTVTEILNN